MVDVLSVISQTVKELAYFEAEVSWVYEHLVRPNLGRQEPEFMKTNFTDTIYGYVMRAFSFLDLFSAYWDGLNNPDSQTERMISFMRQYLDFPDTESRVAVKLWRHTLMHTAQARIIVDSKAGVTYAWLLVWTSEETTDRPLRIVDKKLHMCLILFLRALKAGVDRYYEGLPIDPQMQDRARAALSKLDAKADLFG